MDLWFSTGDIRQDQLDCFPYWIVDEVYERDLSVISLEEVFWTAWVLDGSLLLLKFWFSMDSWCSTDCMEFWISWLGVVNMPSVWVVFSVPPRANSRYKYLYLSLGIAQWVIRVILEFSGLCFGFWYWLNFVDCEINCLIARKFRIVYKTIITLPQILKLWLMAISRKSGVYNL